MELNLRGKVAVVTGASKGIGLAITRALVAEGARVIAGARDVGGELGDLASHDAVRAVSVNLSTPDGPKALVVRAEEFGGLDILVNNVGAVAVRLEGFAGVTDDQWLSSLNLNFMSAVRTTRAALTPMLAQGGGTIVTVQLGQFLSSQSGRDRLLRGEGSADELLEGAVQGSRAPWHPDEHREARSGRDGAVARSGWSGSDRREGVGCQCRRLPASTSSHHKEASRQAAFAMTRSPIWCSFSPAIARRIRRARTS